MCKKIDRKIKARPHLSNNFHGHVLLMLKPVLILKQHLKNLKFSLEELEADTISVAELFHCLAVFLSCKQGKISIEKLIEIFRRLGHQVMHISRLRLIIGSIASILQLYMPMETIQIGICIATNLNLLEILKMFLCVVLVNVLNSKAPDGHC